LNPAYCEIIQQRLAWPEGPVKKRAAPRKKNKANLVIPAKAGIHTEADITLSMDPRFREGDGSNGNEQSVANELHALTTEGTPS
jgi:hypothetical protein